MELRICSRLKMSDLRLLHRGESSRGAGLSMWLPWMTAVQKAAGRGGGNVCKRRINIYIISQDFIAVL